MTVRPVNEHDNLPFPESLEKLMETVELLHLDVFNSYLTLDSGFDSEDNKVLISWQNLIPVIKPNPRNSGREKRYSMLDEFEEAKHIYNERIKIERCFAWKTKYRKLVIRYEKLQCIHMGFRYLAYAMVNSRSIFGKNL
jgi:hypothetical protein